MIQSNINIFLEDVSIQWIISNHPHSFLLSSFCITDVMLHCKSPTHVKWAILKTQ